MLTAQHMEHLRRRGRHTDLDVVLGTELQETLKTCGRMFGPLPFVTVRQEHRKPAQTAPFRFAGTDELIDDDLRTVGEITELPFPDNERIGRRAGVAILEPEYGLLGQQ